MANLTISFDNERARDHFVIWLCEAGEQDYWAWMEYREQEEGGRITAVDFNYHEGGAFRTDLILATCERLDIM